jgi:hypothetical protein
MPLKIYYENDEGKLHCLSGPAKVWDDGDREWYVEGKSHRIDGPAIEYFTTNAFGFYLHDKHYTVKEWAEQLVIQGYKTKEEALFLYLKWASH